MQQIQTTTLLSQLSWRYATKKFDPSKKIPAEQWKALEEALTLAPSSYGLQPWRFFVVENPAVRQQLLPVSWDQKQIVDASHLVVLAAKKNLGAAEIEKYVARIAEVRKAPLTSLDGYKQMMLGSLTKPNPGFDINEWAARQVYIALGVLLSSAALLGIDACPMEGFAAPKYDEILKLSEKGFTATVVCTLGYRDADDSYASAAKVRFAANDVVAHI